MKCHACDKELEIDLTYDSYSDSLLQCPDLHIIDVSFDDVSSKITGYTIYWDDLEKDVRYCLKSSPNRTELRARPLKQIVDPNHKPGAYVLSLSRRYKHLMTIGNFLPPIIKNDKFEVEGLIPRLLKLKAFS